MVQEHEKCIPQWRSFSFLFQIFFLGCIKTIFLKNGIYVRKTTCNIGGFTTHLALSIPLNKSIHDFKPLDDERCDILIKKYAQVKLSILDETSLIGSRMFSFNDKRLQLIKRKKKCGRRRSSQLLMRKSSWQIEQCCIL